MMALPAGLGIARPAAGASSTVVAALNMGGVDGSTTFTDSTGLRVWTAFGNAQIDDSLGYNAALFDGAGDSVRTSYVAADMNWWVGDYTIEAWINVVSMATMYYTSGATQVPALVGNASATVDVCYWSLGPVAGGAIRFFYFNGAGQVVTSAMTAPTGTLCHIAMSKTASGIYIACDGAVDAPVAISGTPQSSAGVPMTLGQINNRSISARVRALRFTKGAARYTSAYTPPTPPLPTS